MATGDFLVLCSLILLIFFESSNVYTAIWEQEHSKFFLLYFKLFQNLPGLEASSYHTACWFSSPQWGWSNSVSTTSLLVLLSNITVKAVEKGPSISVLMLFMVNLSFLCVQHMSGERLLWLRHGVVTGTVSPPSVAVLVLLQAPGWQPSLAPSIVQESLQWPELPTAQSHKQNESKGNCKAWCCYVCISLSQLAEMPLLLDQLIGRLHFSIISLRTEHISAIERKRVVTHLSTCLILSRIVLLMKNWDCLGYTHETN